MKRGSWLHLEMRAAREDERDDGASRHGQAPNQPHWAPLSLLGEPGGHLPFSVPHKGGHRMRTIGGYIAYPQEVLRPTAGSVGM